MNIAIIGLGGVGAYYGFYINEHAGDMDATVSFVARGEAYTRMKEDGLTLITKDGRQVTKPDYVVDNIRELQAPDLVFICVKAYDLADVCTQLKGILKDETVIVQLMNGVDIYDRIRRILPTVTIAPACVYITSHIKEPAVVVQRGDFSKVIYGDHPAGGRSIDIVGKVLEASKVDYRYSAHVERAIWKKYMFIASFGLVTAAYNSSMGTVYRDEKQHALARGVLGELWAISQKKNIGLQSDIVEVSMQTAEKIVEDSPTSLQLDVHSGKGRSELDLFAGTIMRLGEEYGVETPHTERLYDTIKAILKA